MKFSLQAVFAFIFLLGATEANAMVKQCNGCSIASMESKAIALGDGEHHILDLQKDVMKKYSVIIVNDAGYSIERAIEVTPDADMKTKFDNVVQAKREFLSAHFGLPDVPPSIAESAWDLPGDSAVQNNVADWMRGDSNWHRTIGNYTSALLAIAGKVVGINLVLEVDFSDGSTATYKISGINVDGSLNLALNKAKDAENNDIPLTINSFPGTYSFSSGGGGYGMQQAASNFGITITTTGSGSGGSITVTCAQKSGDRVECVATVTQ